MITVTITLQFDYDENSEITGAVQDALERVSEGDLSAVVGVNASTFDPEEFDPPERVTLVQDAPLGINICQDPEAQYIPDADAGLMTVDS